MTLKSTRAYVIRDGKAYCKACGRTRLAQIDGTRYMCCPRCDVGELPEPAEREVVIAGKALLCAECGRNELVAAPNGDGLECPQCDTPPWEREQVAAPAWQQPALDLGPAPAGSGGNVPEGVDVPRPAPMVRRCPFCLQTAWHQYEFRLGKWVPVCDACGNRLSAFRAKSARAKPAKGARG